ncbi:peptidase M16 domain protein [Chloroherpeton thalassium ATCC 35110]|uniref:Peptidase M16 domain protein n=1 Tax=Chloroherpeton thalassium (strain ATCC 35110 / GB-78) TaxID=517418 RepID=B3QT72_CHLT3|nr:M16 family metallopeptidase [Chloroherpeton thalassium]ACF14171.1 peptidase M16 domain protein [Chloroherpeton thalassium ATCC 35110]
MMRLKHLSAVIFFVFLALFSFRHSQVFAREAGEPKKTYSFKTVPNDPLHARIYTLENGLTVYMSVYKDKPRIQTYIAVRAGSKNDPSDATGLAHYLEHLLFKGTSRYGTMNYEKEAPLIREIIDLYEAHRATSDTLAKKAIYHRIDSLSNLAAKYAIPNEYDKMVGSFGAKRTNAYTWVEQTVYMNDIPANRLEQWLTLEAERFREPVMRLFHTELEVVYEEKNRSLDNDNSKIWHNLFAGLFQKHTYGTQTTIGTIEHLKNPSIQKVIDYFNTYYVPNNMAICISGDFDPDETIRMIDDKFGGFQPKPIPEFVPPVEDDIQQPIVKDIYGPDAEDVIIGFRFPGAESEDADMITLIDKLLYNGTAGLIDLNLNQKQKTLGANSFTVVMKDYSAHVLSAQPREGQSLDSVRALLLGQLELLKKGDYPDWLLQAALSDMKLEQIKSYEDNYNRAKAFVEAFVWGMDWEKYTAQLSRLERITKADVSRFAKAHYKNNYVAVYKKTGVDTTVEKVEKPEITPIQVNRDTVSAFAKKVITTKAKPIAPVFIDFKKDIRSFKIQKSIPVFYKKNTENQTFNLYYILDMGTNHDKTIGVALDYLPYLGTSKYSPEELKEAFYKIGCSFSVFSSEDRLYVSLSGLSEYFDKALSLLEEVLWDAQPNEEALKNLIQDILKSRADAKLSKNEILWKAMLNYGKYGEKSPYTNILSKEELQSLTPETLLSLIKRIPTYEHRVLYYGPESEKALKKTLQKLHRTPKSLAKIPDAPAFKEKETGENQVFVVDYDMKQAEILMLSKGGLYDKDIVPAATFFNEYFGKGMSSVVFQELREAKALAYSVFSSYTIPKRKEQSHFMAAYIGTQSDKLADAMSGMFDLLGTLPKSEVLVSSAKESILEQLRTERVTKSDVLFYYEDAKRLGLTDDLRRDVFKKVQAMNFENIQSFYDKFVTGKNYHILVLGKKDQLNIKVLEKYGNVRFLSLEDVFGY